MGIVVDCDCGHHFDVDSGLAGGLTNCPACGKATSVPGLRDSLWRLAQVGGVALVVFLAWLSYIWAGPLAAAVAVVGGIAGVWLLSRML